MNNIKGFRVSAGYTQEDMAKALNISANSYRMKESGERQFTVDEAKLFLIKIREKKPTATLDEIFLG